MAPPSSNRPTGEWSIIKDIINAAVHEAVKKALDGDSSILKGTDAADKEDMRRLVSELRSSVMSAVGDLRQELMDRFSGQEASIRLTVQTEIGTIKSQVATLDGVLNGALKDIHNALHQGDTAFAVLNTDLENVKDELDRVRNNTPLTPHSGVRGRDATTDAHARPRVKDAGGTDRMSKSPTMNILLTAILTAVGTTVCTWGLGLMERGAKDAVKEAAKDEKQPALLAPTPATGPSAHAP